MQYIPPYGSSDPEAPFVDRNTATATRGSAVPAEFFNIMQAELLAVIEGSGLTADANSLQLALAIQSQHMNFAEASGGADAIALSVNPAPAAYAAIKGMPIVALMSASPTPLPRSILFMSEKTSAP
ncbi:MAG: hypothetical protein JZU55_00675 [Afipia sp.]|nr:hypothetical protein [Afipia sp.]